VSDMRKAIAALICALAMLAGSTGIAEACACSDGYNTDCSCDQY
jgi:hypothetical protein